jgi:hypothetical protein
LLSHLKTFPTVSTGLFTLFCPAGQTGPVSGSASTTARSFRFAQTFGLNIPTPLFRHILPALVALPTEVMLRKPLFGLAKRCKQPERYVQSGKKVKKTWKIAKNP